LGIIADNKVTKEFPAQNDAQTIRKKKRNPGPPPANPTAHQTTIQKL